MLLTLQRVDHLADRIERAYLRLRGADPWAGPDRRVWTAAASALLAAHATDPAAPLDPELFVAAQVRRGTTGDPWVELAGEAATRRYLRGVHRIIDGLRRELRAEVRRAEARLRDGVPLAEVLVGRDRSVSPLARGLVALRAGRPERLARLRAAARRQFRACPLYRRAALALLPEAASGDFDALIGRAEPLFSRN